jgi:hypothetical protein
MYESDDPRSALATGTIQNQAETPFEMPDSAECVILSDPPTIEDGGRLRGWYVRGQNFVVNHVSADAGAVLSRDDQPDEYMVLLPDPGTTISVGTPGETQTVTGPSLIIVPPGPSSLTVQDPARLTRLFTARSTDLITRCANAAGYRQPKANLPPFAPWPAPPGGYRIRHYSLDTPDEPGRFGRIWRCTTLMVNVLPTQNGPRDPRKLSPHTHDDFEQGSLGLDGDFVHHLRWPWTANLGQWREDLHLVCPSPSVTVIPPRVLHTTQATSTGHNRLVDIFSPPRRDFSRQPGWVLNADDYPQPESSRDDML